jgi:8-amino-7-oxononanoate synthase
MQDVEIRRFRGRLAETGLSAGGGLFPVQTRKPMPGVDLPALYGRLAHMGVQSVLHRKYEGDGAHLSFIMTARHRPEEIDVAVAAVLRLQRSARQPLEMEVHNERFVFIRSAAL